MPEEDQYISKNYSTAISASGWALAKACRRGDQAAIAQFYVLSCGEDGDDVADEIKRQMLDCNRKHLDVVKIMRELRPALIHFEYCPKCGSLAQTPYAEQCLSCKHEWRGENEHRAVWEARVNAEH